MVTVHGLRGFLPGSHLCNALPTEDIIGQVRCCHGASGRPLRSARPVVRPLPGVNPDAVATRRQQHQHQPYLLGMLTSQISAPALGCNGRHLS